MMPNNKSHDKGRRKFLSVMGAAGLVSIAGCTGGGSDEDTINFAGGASGSAGYNMTTGYSQLLRERDYDLDINSQSTGGTTANVRLISSDDYNMGTVTSTDAIHGANAEEEYDEEYHLRQLFTFNMLPLPICCTLEEHDDIDYVEDLAGTEVAGSPPGTPDAPALTGYLDANGLWDGQEIDYTRDDRSQGLELLERGDVVAQAGYVVNHSAPPWMGEWLSRRDDAKLLFPESQDNVDNFIDEYPGAVEWELSLEEFGVGWENSAYSDQDTVRVPGVTQQFATTEEMDEEQVYDFTRLAFEYADELVEYHDLWTGFSEEGVELAAVFRDEQLPYHPGAAEALQEVGAEDLPQ